MVVQTMVAVFFSALPLCTPTRLPGTRRPAPHAIQTICARMHRRICTRCHSVTVPGRSSRGTFARLRDLRHACRGRRNAAL